MKREVDMKDISDGKLYGLNDMVKADCNDCKGCSACCKNMGLSIQLDPYDIYQLTTGLSTSFEQLLGGYIELNVIEGVILPNIAMHPETNACAFLNEEGRCKVHAIRPGICRLFPLGRFYENGDFSYFLQIHECKNKERSKIKVKKWIDVPDVAANHKFVNAWHDFIKDVQEKISHIPDDEFVKKIDLFILQQFYMEPYAKEDFYGQFEVRMTKAKAVITSLTK